MPSENLRRSRALYRWVTGCYAPTSIGGSQDRDEAAVSAFKKELARLLDDEQLQLSVDRTPRYIRDRVAKALHPHPEEALSGTMADALAQLFGSRGLTNEVLNQEPIQRSTYLVMVNIEFTAPATIYAFLAVIFKADIVIAAYTTFGSYECVIVTEASSEEMTRFLWTTMRSIENTRVTGSQTVSTYGQPMLRFPPAEHPRRAEQQMAADAWYRREVAPEQEGRPEQT